MTTWTIDSVQATLGPGLAPRFVTEIRQTPGERLQEAFDRWVRVAESMAAGADRARGLAEAEAAGEPLPGQWHDVTPTASSLNEHQRPEKAA